MPRRFKVMQEVEVEVIVHDEDAFERVTGPSGGDFREGLYRLHTEKDVLNHWAYNCVQNGVFDATRLDGWADLPDGAVSMEIVAVEDAHYTEEELPGEGPGE